MRETIRRLVDGTTLHRFNTGRHYAANGQEIVWGIIERETKERVDFRDITTNRTDRVVVFVDLARMIDGAIPLFVGNLDLITDRWVLNAYDNHHYQGSYADATFLREMMHNFTEWDYYGNAKKESAR